MHKEVIANIEGVSLFPVIAIVLFIIIFSLIVFYTVRMDNRKLGELSFIPLSEDSNFTLPHGKTK